MAKKKTTPEKVEEVKKEEIEITEKPKKIPIPKRIEETWQDRLVIERDELKDKITKLYEGLKGKKIPQSEVKILERQMLAMNDYLAVLNQRIKTHGISI